jgi:hypothetical protein
MDIEKLQKALAILNRDGKSGTVFGYHDEIQIYPLADKFTDEQVLELDELGVYPHDDDGFMCFT